jgi:hypothetical protein
MSFVCKLTIPTLEKGLMQYFEKLFAETVRWRVGARTND